MNFNLAKKPTETNFLQVQVYEMKQIYFLSSLFAGKMLKDRTTKLIMVLFTYSMLLFFNFKEHL